MYLGRVSSRWLHLWSGKRCKVVFFFHRQETITWKVCVLESVAVAMVTGHAAAAEVVVRSYRGSCDHLFSMKRDVQLSLLPLFTGSVSHTHTHPSFTGWSGSNPASFFTALSDVIKQVCLHPEVLLDVFTISAASEYLCVRKKKVRYRFYSNRAFTGISTSDATNKCLLI